MSGEGQLEEESAERVGDGGDMCEVAEWVVHAGRGERSAFFSGTRDALGYVENHIPCKFGPVAGAGS